MGVVYLYRLLIPIILQVIIIFHNKHTKLILSLLYFSMFLSHFKSCSIIRFNSSNDRFNTQAFTVDNFKCDSLSNYKDKAEIWARKHGLNPNSASSLNLGKLLYFSEVQFHDLLDGIVCNTWSVSHYYCDQRKNCLESFNKLLKSYKNVTKLKLLWNLMN